MQIHPRHSLSRQSQDGLSTRGGIGGGRRERKREREGGYEGKCRRVEVEECGVKRYEMGGEKERLQVRTTRHNLSPPPVTLRINHQSDSRCRGDMLDVDSAEFWCDW